MPRYHVTATSSAPVDAVWRLLIDGRSWPRWSSGLDELVQERSSGLDPHGQDGVGAIRAFRTGRVVTGERLTDLVDGRRRVDAGPGRRHDDQLARTWRMRPGIGWTMPFVLPRVMRRMAGDLAAYAADADGGGNAR